MSTLKLYQQKVRDLGIENLNVILLIFSPEQLQELVTAYEKNIEELTRISNKEDDPRRQNHYDNCLASDRETLAFIKSFMSPEDEELFIDWWSNYAHTKIEIFFNEEYFEKTAKKQLSRLPSWRQKDFLPKYYNELRSRGGDKYQQKKVAQMLNLISSI